MAYNEALAGRIRAALQAQPIVEEKKMFRGVTFMVNGKMCISVAQDEIMVRIDPKLHDELIKKEGCSAMVMKGKPYMGYVLVKESALVSSEDINYWTGIALAFNKEAKAAKKKPAK